jgi:hypothetical protein
VYAISMLFAGRVIDRMGTKRAYVLAIIIWSLGAIGHAYAIGIGEAVNTVFTSIGLAVVPVSVAGFMIGRAVLAVGEAGNFPAAIKATAEYFPKRERSFATGIFNSGANVGAILAPLTVPLIAAHWGWQAAFIVIGGIGFLWMGLWIWLYDAPEQQSRLKAAELAYINSDAGVVVAPTGTPVKGSWFKLLGYRQTWAFAFGKFMTDGVWWFFLFWLPKYMSAQYGMSATDMIIPLVPEPGRRHLSRPHEGHARHRPVPAGRAAGATARLPGLLGSGDPDRHRRFGAPGLVGEPVHDCLGHVPETQCGFGGRHRRHGRWPGRRAAHQARWLAVRPLRRAGPVADRVYDHVLDLRCGVSGGVDGHENAGAAAP